VNIPAQAMLKPWTHVLKSTAEEFFYSAAFVQHTLVFFEKLDEYQFDRAPSQKT